MATLRTPPAAWIEAGLQALAEGGPEAVRIEALAERLGVTKGGFYRQFADRADLLAAMLDTWEAAVFRDVVGEVDDVSGNARAKLERLFTLGSAERVQRIELTVRDWARRDPGVAERLRRVDERRMSYMRSLFAEICTDGRDVEARCLLAFTLFIGFRLIDVDHGSHGKHDVLTRALATLLA